MEVVKLNVGGKRCNTMKSTLLKLPYFQTFFESWNKDKHKEVFLDLDYKIFKYVLNKLRDDNYLLPVDELLLNNIATMFRYFGSELKVDSIANSETNYADCEIFWLEPYFVNDKLKKYEIDTIEHEILEFILDSYLHSFNGMSIYKNGSSWLEITNKNFLCFFEFPNYENQYHSVLKKSIQTLLKNHRKIEIILNIHSISKNPNLVCSFAKKNKA